MIEILIPITLILVVSLSLITFYYLRSRERQMLIEKGLDAESVKEFFSSRKAESSSYNLMKIGIIAITFGIGLSLGIGLTESSRQELWMPLCLFVITGIGFIIANIVGKKLDEKDNRNENIK